MPYHEPAARRDLDLEARELIAAEELGKRRSALEARVLLVAILSGACVGVLGYVGVQEWQFRYFDVAVGIVNVCGFVVPMAGSALLGRRLSSRLLRLRTPGWLDEIARTHQVPRDRLTELLRGINALQ